MKSAIFIRTLEDFKGEAALFKLEPPLVHEHSDDCFEVHHYVIVSAADVPYSGPETYIFPATPEGEVRDWIELDGSFRGALDQAKALRDIGYTVISGNLLTHEVDNQG